jgi:hypothetical protein
VIALVNSLPLLKQEGEKFAPIRYDWIFFCLKRAAARAGYDRWHLTGHIASTIICHLCTGYERNVISADEVRELVVSVLRSIDYAEVAAHFQTLDLPFELSLSELAKEAGPGYELEFFRLLKERVHPALSNRASSLHFSGLRSCVRYLQSAKTWRRSCSELREEIVDFLRAQLRNANLRTEILLIIQ